MLPFTKHYRLDDMPMIMNSKKEIDSLYAQFSKRADLLYTFVTKYSNYIYEPRDYGSGEKMGMLMIHNLTQIDDQPGITVGELATYWNRTKGAISQNIKVLEAKELIYRVVDDKDARVVHLYTTEKGSKLAMAHKVYDINAIIEKQTALLNTCTPEEIDAFYKVLGAYYDLV